MMTERRITMVPVEYQEFWEFSSGKVLYMDSYCGIVPVVFREVKVSHNETEVHFETLNHDTSCWIMEDECPTGFFTMEFQDEI